ncbi:MAG TPA: sulfatase, partial [Candidatus Saccharimonadales bacterium]|nr:sulfatase [Candidatus Saccharimonadales bacterium]
AGWASGLAVSWALSRRRRGAALALLGILPALPALPPLVLLALAARLPGAPGPAAPSLPDVVLITADTLRADRVDGSRGRQITPVVNSVADRGVRFTDCTAHSSWTNPSTASILSGLLPVDHGLRGYGGRIRPDVRTLATILRSHGYETAGIIANPLVSGAAGFSRGFQHWDEDVDRSLLARHHGSLASRLERELVPPGPNWETMDAAEVVNRALEVLDRRGKAPLFLYLHFMDPHNPYDPPPPFAAHADPGYRGSLTFSHGTLYSILRGEIDATDRDIEHARALYDAEARYMDGEIGRLLIRLGSRFEQGKILVAFTADHGEEFMEHGSLGHERTLYQELIHVPLIIARPGRLPEGLTDDEPVAHVDLLPTLLDIAGLPPEIGLPGHSLARALPGSGRDAGDPPPSILSEEDYTGYRAVSHQIRSIREGNAKIILYSPNAFGIGPWRREIFDLSADPLERSPLSASGGKAPELPEGIESRLETWKQRSAATDANHGRLDPEQKQKLKALGYID